MSLDPEKSRENDGVGIGLNRTTACTDSAVEETPGRDDESTSTKVCCDWRHFDGKKKAQGFAFAATGHGSIFMSNVFLSTAFLYLAKDEVGCVDEEEDEIIDDCDERIYGFSTESLVTNIAAIAALLAAFLLPVIGAVIDYTPHRKLVGQIVAFLIFLIQAVQIFIGPKTWFPMAILQAIVGALFEFHYSISSSYLPDLARYDVDSDKFNIFNRIFYSLQFGGEVIYLVSVTGISFALDFSSVQTARVGQVLGSLWLAVTFTGAWQCFPAMPKRHELPEGHSNLLIEGFRQNWRTAKAINKSSKSLKIFYLATVVGEAGTSALLPVAVNLLATNLQYSGIDVGISFMISLVSTGPGIAINHYVTRTRNPVFSAKCALSCAAITTIAAMLLLDGPSTASLGRVFSAFWGFSLGWWYSGQNLLFSFLMPAGQESELSGFFVYCTIVLTWVPPVIYSAIVENGGNAQLGLISLAVFQVLAVLVLKMLPTWDEILESAKTPLKLNLDPTNTGEVAVGRENRTVTEDVGSKPSSTVTEEAGSKPN